MPRRLLRSPRSQRVRLDDDASLLVSGHDSPKIDPMTASTLFGRLPVLSPTVRAAVQLERELHVDSWRARHVLVVPIDHGSPTAVVAAYIAVTGSRLLPEVVPAVGTGAGRSLAQLLGARSGGDLSGLADAAPAFTQRREADEFTDFGTATGVPSISLAQGSQPLNGPGFTAAMTALRRRHRGTVAEVSTDSADALMESALEGASLVVGVVSTPEPPSWLFSVHNPLTRFLDSGRMALVYPFGSGPATTFDRYTFRVPTFKLGLATYADGRSNLPTDGRSLSFELGGVDLTDAAIQLSGWCFGAGT